MVVQVDEQDHEKISLWRSADRSAQFWYSNYRYNGLSIISMCRLICVYVVCIWHRQDLS